MAGGIWPRFRKPRGPPTKERRAGTALPRDASWERHPVVGATLEGVAKLNMLVGAALAANLKSLKIAAKAAPTVVSPTALVSFATPSLAAIAKHLNIRG